MIRPIKQKSVADHVYEKLRDMIYRGEIAPGEKMMPEREMATMFMVGRPTVRNAIQRLIDQRLAVSRRGVGTFVLERDAIGKKPFMEALNGEEFTVTEIQEIRMGLEGKGAELAARRASDQDIRRLKKILEQMRDEGTRGRVMTIQTDILFHMNIAYAGKNRVQIHLMKNFYDLMTYAMSYSIKEYLAARNDGKLVDGHHDRIYRAIAEHEPREARLAMENHIEYVLEVCQDLEI